MAAEQAQQMAQSENGSVDNQGNSTSQLEQPNDSPNTVVTEPEVSQSIMDNLNLPQEDKAALQDAIDNAKAIVNDLENAENPDVEVSDQEFSRLEAALNHIGSILVDFGVSLKDFGMNAVDFIKDLVGLGSTDFVLVDTPVEDTALPEDPLQASENTIGIFSIIILGIQFIPMIVSIILTERALKKTFTDEGIYK